MSFYNIDSSDDETELDDYKGKNGIMFLVDFREDMFEMDTRLSKSYFKLCMNTCRTLMIDVARSGKDDLVGVSLMGTERGTKGGMPLFANIHPLDSVSADSIKSIDQIIVDNGDSLRDNYGRIDKSSNLNLVKIFNSCIKLFIECPKKVYTKTVVIMTKDDDPFGSDIQLAHSTRKQAKRFSSAAIDLVVVGLGDDFRPNQFYNEIVSLSRGEATKDWAKTNRIIKLGNIDNHLMSLMSRLSRTNRDLVIMTPYVSIPVSLYKLFKEPKVSLKRKVVIRPNVDDIVSSDDESKANGVNSLNVNIPGSGESTPKLLAKDRKEMCPLVGGKVINITRNELESAEFPQIGAGLTLICFKPSVDIPEYLTVVPPRVMLPNYFSPEGRKAFTCLLEICREQKLSMVCWYRYNRYCKVSLVVCHPMPEQSDAKGNICPAGFCVVTIPFSDNYADPDTEKLEAESSEKQMEAARQIVKKLSLSYSVETFHDFELQKMLGMIEALALDYDEVPSITDDTILEDESIDCRIEDFIDDFNDCSHLGPCDSIAAAKRPASAPSYRASKNPKLSSDEGMLDVVKEGKADMLTVAQLKNILSSKGILYSGSAKKAQLVELAHSRIK